MICACIFWAAWLIRTSFICARPIQHVKILFLLLLVPLFSAVAHADTQTASTEDGTLDVRLQYGEINPDENTKVRVDFLNPATGNIQQHIDYTIKISRGGELVFGPIPLTHTSPGTVTIPVNFKLDGLYTLDFIVEGILFQPMPPERASFDIAVGQIPDPPQARGEENKTETPPAPSDFNAGQQTADGGEANQTQAPLIPDWVKTNAGWWAEGLLDDDAFVVGLEYLIQNGIMVIPDVQEGPDNSEAGRAQIPPWIKTNAGWWAEGLLDDAAFVAALQYLIGQGIIRL